MSTNYFSTPTYRPQTTVNPYAVSVTPLPIPGQADIANADAGYGSLSDQPNYATRAGLAAQLGTGPGSISERYRGLMQARQARAAAELRGYGGISFNQKDDLSTPQNESLSPSYESGRMGQNENDAYKHALATGASRGIVYSTGGDQLVGSALQRVSEEARAVINQYAGDINGLATQQLTESQGVLTNYQNLYGSDAASMLQQNATAPVQEPTIQRFSTKPNVDPKEFNVITGGDGAFYTLKVADFPNHWGTYAKAPNRKALDNPATGPGAGNYVVVKGADGKWEVKVK